MIRGFYWVTFVDMPPNSPPVIASFDGDWWWRDGFSHYYMPSKVTVVSERLEPPTPRTEPPPAELLDKIDAADAGVIQFIGKAVRRPDGTYLAFAEIDGCLCLVEGIIKKV
jgi:hypothetical protein